MSGLSPQNGATDQSQSPIVRIEFCGMTQLQLNYFHLINSDTSIFSNVIVNKGEYWATLQPTINLLNGVTYSLEIDGRINDGGTVKQIAAGTWEFTVQDIEDSGILYNEDFSGTSYTIPHTLTALECLNNFNWTNTLPATGGTMHLVDDPDPAGNRGTVLKVDFAEGNYGTGVPVPGYPAMPNGMRSQIWSDAGRDELYFAFDIYFPNDFVFPLTMRGPALWGGEFHETASPADYGKRVAAEIRSHGANLDVDAINNQYVCQQTNNIDGEIGLYSYDATQSQYAQKLGTEYKKGEWNRVEFYVKINDPITSTNGKLYCWLNGVQIGANTAIQWISSVDSGLQFETAQLLFSGDNSCWVTPKSQSLYIDNIIISENPIHEVLTDEIKIYSTNPWYWEYKGQPTLLLGGSIHSNLFHVSDLQSQLTEIQSAGGNYVRCTMSQRTSWNLPGDMDLPYASSGGLFDLDTWNPSYWTKFADMLLWCFERDIIVQIELWDRWDFRGGSWDENAFRPANNSTYTTGSSGLADTIATPSSDAAWANMTFFNTVPDLDNNTVVLPYQQAFVDEVLNHTLQYNNVLYCVGNETKSYEEWGTYWAEYIKTEAQSADISVEVTQMMDDRVMNSSRQKLIYDHPETYSYLDISQNTHQSNETQWDGLQYTRDYIIANESPLPINNTKVYGADGVRYSDAHAIECFWRNIIGGSASTRFHRPPDGLGISQLAKNAIIGARKLETKVVMWEMTPQQGLLSSRGTDEAYLSAEVGQQYALYFTSGGAVDLDLDAYGGSTFDIDWIDGDAGTWGTPDTVAGGATRTITAPSSGPWIAAIVLQ